MWGAAIVWVLSTGSDNQVMVMMCVALSALTLSIANIAYSTVYAAFAAPVSLSAAFGFALSDRYGSVLLSFGAVAMPAALLMISHRRSEEHTSELQSLMRTSYARFCLKEKQ